MRPSEGGKRRDTANGQGSAWGRFETGRRERRRQDPGPRYGALCSFAGENQIEAKQKKLIGKRYAHTSTYSKIG